MIPKTNFHVIPISVMPLSASSLYLIMQCLILYPHICLLIINHSIVNYAHLDGHENILKEKKEFSTEIAPNEVISSTDMTTVNSTCDNCNSGGFTDLRTKNPLGVDPNRRSNSPNSVYQLDFEGAITDSDMTFASEKSRDNTLQ